MTAYAVAHLRSVDQNAEIVDYLRRIDATLDPFDGRFVVHGVLPEVLEGEWPGVLVVIGSRTSTPAGLVRLARVPGDPPAAHPQLRRRHAGRRRCPTGYRAAAYAEKLASHAG